MQALFLRAGARRGFLSRRARRLFADPGGARHKALICGDGGAIPPAAGPGGGGGPFLAEALTWDVSALCGGREASLLSPRVNMACAAAGPRRRGETRATCGLRCFPGLVQW